MSLYKVTQKEYDLAGLLTEPLTQQELAEKLKISESCFNMRVHRLAEKLKVRMEVRRIAIALMFDRGELEV